MLPQHLPLKARPRVQVSTKILSHAHLHKLNACCLHSAKKDAKRLAKEAKFAAKSAAKATTAVAGEAKAKVAKPKKEEEAPFVNTTPKGEKKGMHGVVLYRGYC